jgi:hypothetical protein
VLPLPAHGPGNDDAAFASVLQAIPPIRLLAHCSRVSGAVGEELLIEVVAYGAKATAKARMSVSRSLPLSTRPQSTSMSRTPDDPMTTEPLAVQDQKYKLCAHGFNQDYMRLPAEGMPLTGKC